MSAADQVRQHAETARYAVAKRDGAIRKMRSEGASLREIATAAGLTHAGVAKILKRPAVLGFGIGKR